MVETSNIQYINVILESLRQGIYNGLITPAQYEVIVALLTADPNVNYAKLLNDSLSQSNIDESIKEKAQSTLVSNSNILIINGLKSVMKQQRVNNYKSILTLSKTKWKKDNTNVALLEGKNLLHFISKNINMIKKQVTEYLHILTQEKINNKQFTRKNITKYKELVTTLSDTVYIMTNLDWESLTSKEKKDINSNFYVNYDQNKNEYKIIGYLSIDIKSPFSYFLLSKTDNYELKTNEIQVSQIRYKIEHLTDDPSMQYSIELIGVVNIADPINENNQLSEQLSKTLTFKYILDDLQLTSFHYLLSSNNLLTSDNTKINLWKGLKSKQV